mgnify:CR=1 FL=1
MEFDNNRPIYLQICDAICERILSGELEEENRIPSVRDYGAEIEVNPNTVMRSYEKLTADGLIYNRRGIGYFISPDALETVLEAQRKDFLENELPQILKRMKLLGLDSSLLKI